MLPVPNRPAERKVGRPHPDWAQTLFSEIFRLTQVDRNNVALMAQNRRIFQNFVKRLCNMFDRT